MDWVLGSIGGALDVIELRGVTARGKHGLLPQEREDGQVFKVDLALHLDTRDVSRTDVLADTVDYSQAARVAVELIEGEPVHLIETLAARIAEAVLELGSVKVADVTVHKPEAPLGVEFDDVSVRVRRAAQESPAVFVQPDSAMFEAVGEAERLADLVSEPDGAQAIPPRSARHALPPASPGEAAASVEEASSDRPGPEAAEKDRGDRRGSRRRRHQDDSASNGAADEAPETPVDAIVALGANLGEALGTLRSALDDLREEPGIEVAAVSPLARTAPIGRPDQPDFFNAVAHIRTTLSPRMLLRTLQGIEEKHGRQRAGRWAPRTLDLDLIAYDTLLIDEDELTIPHPRAHERAFVLVPWSLMSPNAFLPGLGGGPVAALAESAPDRSGIRWLAPAWDRPHAGALPPGEASSSPSAQADAAAAPGAASVADHAPGALARDEAGGEGRTGTSGSTEAGTGGGLRRRAGRRPEGAGGADRRRVRSTAGPKRRSSNQPSARMAGPGKPGPIAGPFAPAQQNGGADPLASRGWPAGTASATGQYPPAPAAVEVEGVAEPPASAQASPARPGELVRRGGFGGPASGGDLAAYEPVWGGAGEPAVPAGTLGAPGGLADGGAGAGADQASGGWRPTEDPEAGGSLPVPLPAARPRNPYISRVPGVPSFFAAARQANQAGEAVVVESAQDAAGGDVGGAGSSSSAFASAAGFEAYAAARPDSSVFSQLELARVPATARLSSRNEVEAPYPAPGSSEVFEPVVVAAPGAAMPAREPRPLPAPAEPVAAPAFVHPGYGQDAAASPAQADNGGAQFALLAPEPGPPAGFDPGGAGDPGGVGGAGGVAPAPVGAPGFGAQAGFDQDAAGGERFGHQGGFDPNTSASGYGAGPVGQPVVEPAYQNGRFDPSLPSGQPFASAVGGPPAVPGLQPAVMPAARVEAPDRPSFEA
ncbi:MAG: 2-amino-4-hydroxy-6-hydroxymethyldihydropteridine diphosphokinase, partial [Bifidobacteriaceae bacterium]|nr:2-amino-4-hydroxy-6-hydroxymethyldihydropteridine diphosphokinase [Bifidobacteriaceae bacterium]